MKEDEDTYTISVGVMGADGNTKRVVGMGGIDEHYQRRLGLHNFESNKVLVSKGRKGIALIMYNPAIHHLKFLNPHREVHNTFESTEGFQRILPGDEVEITLKSRVGPTTNGDSSLYVIYDRADPQRMMELRKARTKAK